MNIKRITSIILFAAISLSAEAAGPGRVKCFVRDADGPLVGAVVQLSGSNNAAVTDLDGVAELEQIPADAVLKISLLGYVAEEVKVDGRAEIRIELLADAQTLSDVVVIAYGTAKRKDFTGSIASVNLEKSPVTLAGNTNALEMLKGNVSGLDIGATNSAGGQPSVQMRGQRSLSGSNAPLFVLDGVVFTGSINDLNPGDIASIDVLKDASSAAAYGSRSANGVVIITTRKGNVGKPVISFNAQGGVSTWGNKPVMKTGQDYVDMVLARNQTDDMSWMTIQERRNYDAGVTTDWLDYATRIGWKQNYQLSVSGATSKLNYYVSSSLADVGGIVKGDNFKRTSLLGKLSTDITSWMKLSVGAAFSRQDRPGNPANIQTAYFISPYGMPKRIDGVSLEKYPMTQSDGLQNPLWQSDDSIRQSTDVVDNYRLDASLLLTCPWIEGLTFRCNYNLNRTLSTSTDFRKEGYFVREGAYYDDERYSTTTCTGLLSKATGSIGEAVKNCRILDLILNYSHQWDKHDLDATLVSTRDYSTYDTKTVTGSDFSDAGNTNLGIDGLAKAENIVLNQDGTMASNIGYLARVMYSYDSRYSFTASYRRDGASVFGAKRKWGNFYSFGGAWTPSNEAFWPESLKPVLGSLKLKVSWGRNGNQGISAFGTQTAVQSDRQSGLRYEFNGTDIQYGIKVSSLGNPDLGWETTDALNAGIESSWIGGRLFFDVDGYYSITRDQIFNRTIPSITGFSTVKSTMGRIDNFGVEATLRSVNVQNRDFAWNSSLTFWLNRNKLVSLYGEDNDGDGREDDDISNSLFIGKGLGAIYGYVQDGIVQEDDFDYIGIFGAQPGYPKYVDLNGDDQITSEDRTILGYSQPNFRLNLSNTLQYRNFELYFMVTGVFGGNNRYLRPNANAYRINGFGYATGNAIDIEWWTPENRSNVYPSAAFTSDGRFLGLQDRTFVRLQDLSLSYSFRMPRLQAAGIRTLKLFVSCKNLLTFTKWVGDDPETGSSVLSSTLPVCKSVSGGVNFSF